MSYARSLAVLFAIMAGGVMSATADEKPVEIPLDQIWSNAAASSRSLQSVEPELHIYRDTPEKIKKYSTPEGLAEMRYKAKQSLVLQIERAMRKLPVAKETKPKQGFAVAGIGREALVGIHDVLVLSKGPQSALPAGTDVSIVFFSHPERARVAIDRIERHGNVVRIHFMLISHGQLNISSSLAIIPLGQLPAGEYRVEMVRSPNELKHNQPGFPPVEADAERLFICRPFEFSVEERKDAESLDPISVKQGGDTR